MRPSPEKTESQIDTGVSETRAKLLAPKELPMFAFIVGAWVALSIMVAACAFKKGLNSIDYFLLSFFLSPLVGAVIFLLRSRQKAR